MALTIAEGIVEVTADAKGVGRDIAREIDDGQDVVGNSGRRMGGTFIDVFKGSFLGGALANIVTGALSNIGEAIGTGIRTAWDFALGTIDIASDLNESFNAVSVAYGPVADSIIDLGKTSARTFGLSKRDLNSYAVQFSAFSRSIAGDGGDITGTFANILGRATDFASVMNLEVADSLTLFQSGLAGETEPLRRYGIDLSAAAVEAYAYAHGIGVAGEELTEQQKVMGRYGALLEQTSAVQGDFANTSDELANKNRINAALWDDIQAKIGEGFLPVASALASVLTDTVFPAITELTDEYGPGIAQAFEDVTPALKGFVEDVLPKLPGLIERVAEAAPEFLNFLSDATGFVIDMTEKFDGGADQISDFFTDINANEDLWFSNLGPKLEGGAQQWGDFFTGVGDFLQGFSDKLVVGQDQVFTFFGDIGAKFEGGAVQIGDFFTGVGGFLQGFADKLAVGQDQVFTFFGQVGQAFGNGWNQISNFFGQVGGAVSRGIGEFGRFAGEVGANVGRAVDFVASIPGRAGAAIGNVGRTLFSAGQSLIQGFIDGIKGMINNVGNAVGGVVEWAASFFPHSPAKRGPLSGAGWTAIGRSGGAIMDQFMSGFDETQIGPPFTVADLEGSRSAPASRTIGRGVDQASSTSVSGGGAINVTVNEATDPLGSAGRVGRELRKWKAR